MIGDRQLQPQLQTGPTPEMPLHLKIFAIIPVQSTQHVRHTSLTG